MIESRPLICLVVAVSDNGIIGQGNKLPWHLPADLAHFKRITLGKPILMGRRTWESLPGLLPQRQHIVLTGDPNYRAEGCTLVGSLDQAVAAAGEAPELMVVGGAVLFAETLPLADRLYLTQVHAQVEGDVRFPPWEPADWEELSRIERPADERNPIPMTFLQLQRVRADGDWPLEVAIRVRTDV
jgi:dihydrofolate reductase